MAGPGESSGDQQAGQGAQPPSPIDEALVLGGERAGYLGREQEIAEGIGGLAAKRTELETGYKAELGRLEDQLHGDLGKLGDQRVELEGERETLTAKRGTNERKMKRLGGRIRALADRDDAMRGDQLAFAAYITGDISPDGLANLAAVDELVQAEAGELFVVHQGEHVAFGKILPENSGLLITTEQEPRRGSIDRVHLPIKQYIVAGEDDVVRVPTYGWVSGGFDAYKEEYQYDSLEGRGPEEAEMVNGRTASSPFSNFNVSQANLHLVAPTKLQIARAFSGEVVAKEVLKRGGEGSIMTGTVADAYLHAFIGSRLDQMSYEVESDRVSSAFSRAIVVASKLGVAIDISKISGLEASLSES